MNLDTQSPPTATVESQENTIAWPANNSYDGMMIYMTVTIHHDFYPYIRKSFKCRIGSTQ